MPRFTTESKHLKWQVLEGRDWVLTIDRVAQEVLEKDGKRDKKWILYFKELDKGLALNATNGKTLIKLFNTDEMNSWVSKRITLGVKDDIEYGGELVSGIRIRPKLPTE